MEKILTIIIPTYNMEKYLHKCLDSLIVSDDNMKLLEVLIINDGSKDSSSQIAHEYESKFPNTFRVIDKENGNYGSCINRGIKELTGKYVKVLDADDYFDTKELNNYIQFLLTSKAECILSDFDYVNGKGRIRNSSNLKLKTGIHNLDELSDDKAMAIWMHEVTYLADILNKIGYQQTEGISYTDQEWIFLPFAFCKTWEYYPHVIYKYYVGRPGQTVNKNVWEENFWMELQGMYAMLNENEKYMNSIHKAGANYLNCRLKKRSFVIYNAMYFLFRTDKNLDALRKFDHTLSVKNPDIIKWLEEKRLCGIFRYIKRYRINFRSSNVVKVCFGMGIKVISLLCRIKVSIQNIL